MESVGTALVARGHRVTFVHEAQLAAQIRTQRIGFHPLEGEIAETGRARPLRHDTEGENFEYALEVVARLARTTDYLGSRLAPALRAIGAECVVVDHMEAAGALAAEALQLPFVSVMSAIPNNREPDIPPTFIDWRYDPTPRGRRRNQRGHQFEENMMAELSRTILRQTAKLGLPRRHRLTDCLSPYAQISQMVSEFDFPRRALPSHYHAVGSLRDTAEEDETPVPVDPRRPVVFISLGTIQGWRIDIFQAAARACAKLNVQSLLAHCGKLTDTQVRSLPVTFVTDFLPQRRVLDLASAVVTHAGMSTVIDALVAGCPMLAIPFAFDQPAIAARIARSGAGLYLKPDAVDEGAVEKALLALLSVSTFAARARAIGNAVSAAGGVERAVDIIETVARTGRRVNCSDCPSL